MDKKLFDPLSEPVCQTKSWLLAMIGSRSSGDVALPKTDDARPQAQNAAAMALQAKFNRGLALHQQGKLAEAERIYSEVLEQAPNHFDALHLLGVIAVQTKQTERAVELITKAIGLNAKLAAAHSNLGSALRDLSRPEEALASYDKAIGLKPDSAEAYSNRGEALRDLKRPEDALASCDKAIALKPDYANAYNNRGNALMDLRRPEDALASYDKAIALKPDYAEAYSNRGEALRDLKRPEDALASCDKAIALKPDYADAYNNRGNALMDLRRPEDALASYDKAIALKPDGAEAYNNRGNALIDLKRPEDALASYDKAIALKSNYEFLFGTILHTKMKICDWETFDQDFDRLRAKLTRYENASSPFPVLSVTGSPELQKIASQIWVRNRHSVRTVLPAVTMRAGHKKIKLGYFSADYHNHPVMSLIAGMLEAHDKSKFETIALSYGPNINDEMRQRVMRSFDRFYDVRNSSDKDVALLCRSLEVSIAVDLSGFTKNNRTDIFAFKAAPIHVNYLGYPGTMGAKYIDYIIADAILIPEYSRQHYSEKIVYLPNSYQVNDAKRAISDKVLTRAELGLPPTVFVFCCFNNSFKITPHVFDGWMRILKKVEGGVLWLLEDNAKAASNLKKEAGARGVDAERLIFAKRLPLAEHMARHQLADLFLDTLPYNAHTTASDALWAGLPVLTCIGESFAGRVAASLLNAIHLSELITNTPEAYEAFAVQLATHPNQLRKIKKKLINNRLTTPLFDTKRFTKHIEAAYTAMYERCLAGLPPADIYVPNS
jgi:predicted O-linked N-acetylglucosamine transferase (SPINDLY family)